MNYKLNLSKLQVTSALLMRWAGLCSILAGILYILIQLIHPSDHISSVGTTSWFVVACMTLAMAQFSLIGITAIYMRQLKESGWFGLVGFLLFGMFWIASIAFSFIEAFVLPILVNEAPLFVEAFLGLFGETSSTSNLGAFPVLATLAGILYLLGGLMLGVATFRAGILPRSAAALLAFGSIVTLAAAIIPHPFDRILAIPMGVAFMWLGYMLWSQKRY